MLSLIQRLKDLWKKHSNNILLTLKYVSIVLVLALAHILAKKWDKKPVMNTHEIPPIPETETVYIKDEIYSKTLEQSISVKNKLIDSLAKALSVKRNQIKTVDRIVTVLDTVIVDSIVYISTKDSTIFSYQDKYINLFTIGKENNSYFRLKLTPDTIDITKVHYTPLFGKAYTNGYIHHSNPYFNSPTAATFSVEQPQALFDIGISGGFDFISQRPYLGIGISPSFAKIKIYKRRK